MPDVNEDPVVVNNMVVQLDGVTMPVGEDGQQFQQALEDKLREARRRQQELDKRYPYMEGGATVLGPEVFAKGGMLCWKGVNYVPQEHEQALRTVRTVAGIHCGALFELLHDAGIQMPENALRVYQLLYDELTLTMPALAKAHPAVLPRLPEGMQ